MFGLLSLGGLNGVLLKVLYTAYGDHRAFFVNQAVNLLYILFGGAILYPRMIFSDVVTPEMRRTPQRHFVLMGILDSLGTFLTCCGATYTPGSLQPLLNQLLIPCTMLVSVVYLKVRCRWREAAGAGLIVAGACVSVLPHLLLSAPGVRHHRSAEIRWYAVLFYALSNFPMAVSSCYKESQFEEKHLDVWYLTQWVSIYQFLVSFLYMPLLILPGFGSRDGMSWSEVWASFYDGFRCYVQEVPECATFGAFWLLTGYCAVNVCFNTLGLYLTKHGSAVLNALSYSILLPFTTMLFFTPLLGRFQEPLTSTVNFTAAGLALVLGGFAIYQRYSKHVGVQPVTAELPVPLLDSPLPSPKGQPSFQERIVGTGILLRDYLPRRSRRIPQPAQS